MQEGIHPNYQQIKVIMPDGSEHSMWSTLNKKEFHLDVDWRKHPAWTQSDSIHVSQTNEKVAQFNKRFGSLNLLGNKEEN